MKYWMIIMQTAQTKTLPIDKNILIGLTKKKGYALQLPKNISASILPANVYLYPTIGFPF